MSEQDWIIDNPISTNWPIYTRGNVGEVFPNAVSPLSFASFGSEAEDAWRRCYFDLGIMTPKDLEGEGQYTILGIFNGYCYLNVSLLRLVAIRAPGASVEAMDKAFFGEGAAPPYVARPGDKSFMATIKILFSVLKVLKGKFLHLVDVSHEQVNIVVNREPAKDADDAAHLDAWEKFGPNFNELFYDHIFITTVTNIVHDVLLDMLTKLGHGDKMVDLIGAVVGEELSSAQPAHAMWKLGRIARETPEVDAAFEAGVEGIQERLSALPEAAEFNQAFAKFIEDFGFRGANEWEMISETWETHPEIALAAIDRMRKAEDDRSPTQAAARSRRRAEDTLAKISQEIGPKKAKKLRETIELMAQHELAREQTKTNCIKAINSGRRSFFELARRACANGGPSDPRMIAMQMPDTFKDSLANPAKYKETFEQRWLELQEKQQEIPPFILDGVVTPSVKRADLPAVDQIGSAPLKGIAGSSGLARGKARVVLHPSDPKGLEPGEILVAPITDPSWTPLFVPASAVVVEVGAVISHAVIVARELGVPCVCSVEDATRKIPDGTEIEVDGSAGEVRLVS